MRDPALVLAVSSAFVLALLVWHSLRALPPRRCALFWGAVALYGLVRGISVRLVTEHALDARFPYIVHRPHFAIAGVSVQELAGWAIVAYLGWWLGWRFARSLAAPPRLGPQILWGSIFLGAVGWTVEAAAGASGWWHWTLPVDRRLLLGVPWIGLVDWFFVGLDFLLPFTLLTSGTSPHRARSGVPWRWLALGVFPLHIGSHAFTDAPAAFLPIPFFHVVHWSLLGLLLWIGGTSRLEDDPFRDPDARMHRAPTAALLVVVLVATLLGVATSGSPSLLLAAAPCLLVLLGSSRPRWLVPAGASAALLAPASPPLLIAAIPAGAGAAMQWATPDHRHRTRALLALLVCVALVLHEWSARRDRALRAGLEVALAARDAGDLRGAISELEVLNRRFPDQHAPSLLLAEVLYRTDRLDEAARALRASLLIKDHLPRAHRFLAVIGLRRGDPRAALSAAEDGLVLAPDDLELRYLRARARALGPRSDEAGGRPGDAAAESDLGTLIAEAAALGPHAPATLAALAFEVGDHAASDRAVEAGLRAWPAQAHLHEARLKLALARGDAVGARRAAGEWAVRLPRDSRPRAWLQSLPAVSQF